jgi:DNA polymerase-3 subunit delta'
MTTAKEPDAIVVPPEFLPWHDGARSRLAAAVAGSRLPHALLLHGPDGVGKERFAAALAAGLFCRRAGPDLAPCGDCAECALSRAGSHPDLHWLRRPEDRKSIGVDAVREACERLGMTSLRGGYRVAVVTAAQLMTHSAQNAFLKTLEEPASRTMLVLVTQHPSGLLATLRSRCQRIEIPSPAPSNALEWLERELGSPLPPGLLDLAGGAPLRALALAPHYESLESQMTALLAALAGGRIEVTQAAAEMMGEGLGTRLDWLERWLSGTLRVRLAPDATQVRIRGAPTLQRAAAALNMHAAFRFVDRLRESRRLLQGSAAPQLVVESLLIELEAAFRNRGVARWVP